MPATLKPFQEDVCAGIVARIDNVRMLYASLATAAPERMDEARRNDGAVVLQAPTGAGKTLIAVEAMRRVSTGERVLWFWFAPFAGLVEQSRAVIASQGPELALFDLDSDRRLDAVRGGGVFVTTWASVAARSADSRRARTRSDSGLSIDEVIAIARAEGLRIGCVVDEAHHGFHRAAQARAFFSDVLAPDYTLMMTATPRDADALAFQRATGYKVGEPADWASVSRFDAVEAGLLKRGVRMVRFVARDGDTAQLVDFEHLALRECATMHRSIQQALTDAGIALTPLMLVQVPDGSAAQHDARHYLVETLGFAETAVRVHTAAEPDPDLLALAQDPTVDVLIFKMAVALGFDAPRAFTLAALRGARDAGFGVQVIGRIVRCHALLQARDDLPPLLQHGYVFLANAQSQEGLMDAGAQINALTTQAPELGTQTVVTVIGDTAQVQVVRSGEPLSLLVSQSGSRVIGDATGADDSRDQTLDMGFLEPQCGDWTTDAQTLLGLASGEDAWPNAAVPPHGAPRLLSLTRDSAYRYRRRVGTPDRLRSERLPAVPTDFEAQLADFVDFNEAVLSSRLRTRVQVQRSESDLFSDSRIQEDGTEVDIWANVSPEAVAQRAEQIRLRLSEANDRELYERLLRRFKSKIEQSGAELPANEELLMQQLDLVQVRHPNLLKEAYRRLRHGQVIDMDVLLLPELHSDLRLPPAQRALYGVVPPGLNEDEKAIAAMLDVSPLVNWWHRNPSDHRRADALGLYRWDEGAGFFPDFVVSLHDRQTPGGIALLEPKGGHLWGEPHEVEKAQARHQDYGSVFVVGRRRGESDFFHLRKLGDRLQTDGSFTLDRLRHA